ncbi:hypothetical protein YC2023_083785 [Brassica napus]
MVLMATWRTIDEDDDSVHTYTHMSHWYYSPNRLYTCCKLQPEEDIIYKGFIWRIGLMSFMDSVFSLGDGDGNGNGNEVQLQSKSP